MKAIDLFCGAGGASQGLRQAGLEVILAVDSDRSALATHEANHPEVEHLRVDVLSLLADDYSWPQADMVWASPPCQQFSVANSKRDPTKGMELVYAALDCVDEVRPSLGWCMENVPPVKDYLPMSRIPTARILNAADYGVPQRRRRCFYGQYAVPNPTHAPPSERGQQTTLFGGPQLQTWVTVRDALGDLLYQSHPEEHWSEEQLKRIIAGKRDPSSIYHGSWAAAGQMEFPDSLHKPARTITATALAPGREAFVLEDKFQQPYTDHSVDRPAPTLRAAGLRSNYHFKGVSMEDGLTPGVARSVDDVAPTIRAEGTRPTIRMSRSGGEDHRRHPVDEPAHTLSHNSPQVYGIGDLRGSDRAPRAWDPDEPAPTVVDPNHDRKVTEVEGRSYRRLTTLEAALLQGFPPDYKWVGSKTATYRQIGNAVCPPVAMAIALATLAPNGQ